MRAISILKNPLIWFLFLILGYSAYKNFKFNEINNVLTSDGRGYYVYLPAILIFDSFEKSSEVEKSYFKNEIDQYYLFKDSNGRIFNKYFPGVSLMQLPFFLFACLLAWLFNLPLDGYSTIFLYLFYVGGLAYSISAYYLFNKFLIKFYTEKSFNKWLVPIFYSATPLLFYSFNTISFSHLYSFFLFVIFSLQVIKLKDEYSFKGVFYLGLIVGLIFLVRPTNILIIFIIPFLLVDYDSLKSFFKKLMEEKGKGFILGLIGFLSLFFVLLLVWKWQSGSWIVWSYNGEGFNFNKSQLLNCLFSFRTGLFIQTPILIFSILSVILLFKNNKYQNSMWIIYFIITSWVISCWWCWDYESSFGNRAFSEHMMFTLLPILPLIFRYKFIIYYFLLAFSILGVIRYFEKENNFMNDQRFTSSNYFESLKFWENKNKNRWNFTKSCIPYGRMLNSKIILEDSQIHTIKENDEFIYGAIDSLLKPRTSERYYYRVELEKQTKEKSFEGVMLVIDAFNTDLSKRYYKTIDLFNDRLEGKKYWKKLEFEGMIHDNFQEFDNVKIYIWNQGKKRFKIRNCKIVIEKFKS